MHIQRLFSRPAGLTAASAASCAGGDPQLSRRAALPILAPLTLLKHYLAEYPDRYLRAQNYFDPYPQDLAPAT
ncbi:DUF1722 domain-containing protein [Klebsiella pneumoniae]|nr:DUF1722 domain-containing protein [Klebsiella pneumoniae]